MASNVVGNDREKLEATEVVQSGLFDRAPMQAQVFSFLCSKYFAGAASEIKEYTIAVEALGKPPTFDHKRDSIVRVEMHQLRKRLREFYATEGANRGMEIQIPPGQYVPVFLPRAGALPRAEPADLHSTPPAATAARAIPPPRYRLMGVGAALLVLVALAGIGYLVRSRTIVSVAADKAPAAVPLADGQPDVRIMAGMDHGTYVDGFGHLWEPDRFFHGGWAFHDPNHLIAGTRDPTLFRNRREGPASYDIPLKPGVYELRLYFSENVYGDGNIGGGGETSRLFDIFINDKEIAHQFDVIGNAGPSMASILALKDVSPGSDGKLHLRLVPNTSVPFINAIEISPGIPGRLKPVRLVARDRQYTDNAGRFWLPDRYSNGGQLVLRDEAPSNTATPGLYSGERFGNFSYRIPVAQGQYRIKLYFCERWFGPGKPGGDGPGKRTFDVLCNGVALVSNLDIYQRANGANRALELVFHNMQPSPQGLLNITFVPRVNYACVNAIEVADESGE